jgi:hypothetical protein
MMSMLSFFAATDCPDRLFLGLVPWYHYLNLNSSCQFDDSHPFALLGSQSSLLLILLAVVDDLMRVAGLLAVVFVIYAGIKYITSQGDPGETAKAQSTLLNSLVGLAIAIVAIGTVSFIGNKLAGGPGAGTVLGLDLSPLPSATGAASGSIIQTVLSLVFGVVGALSLLFVVIGGFRYVLSQGDPKNVSQAKNTVFYALIGLAVAIVAESIVSFVVGRITP